MGLGSFMTNFGIGFLSQANAGFADQRKMQYEQDLRHAQTMDKLAASAIDDYQNAERDARAKRDRYNELKQYWGPDKADYIMRTNPNMSLEDMARIQVNPGAGPSGPSYLDDVDENRFSVYNSASTMLKAGMNGKSMPNGLDIGQIFPPPTPFGTRIQSQYSPLQQQQIQARQGGMTGQGTGSNPNKQPNTGMPPSTIQTAPLPPQGQPPQGQAPQGAPPGFENAQSDNVPVGNGRITLLPKDRAASGTNLLPAQKYILGSIGSMLEPYNVEGKGVAMVQNPATGEMEVHFNSPVYAQTHQLLMGLVQPDIQTATQYASGHGIALNSIDWTPILTKAQRSFDYLLAAAQRAGITETDKQIAWIAALKDPHKAAMVVNREWAAQQKEAQDAEAKANQPPQATVGAFKDPKVNPNNPAAQLIQERYEEVQKHIYDVMMENYKKQVEEYKRGNGNQEPVEPTMEDAGKFLDSQPISKFEAAISVIDQHASEGGIGPPNTDAYKPRRNSK